MPRELPLTTQSLVSEWNLAVSYRAISKRYSERCEIANLLIRKFFEKVSDIFRALPKTRLSNRAGRLLQWWQTVIRIGRDFEFFNSPDAAGHDRIRFCFSNRWRGGQRQRLSLRDRRFHLHAADLLFVFRIAARFRALDRPTDEQSSSKRRSGDT